jgi:LEA14-like dessication related protein
MVFDVDVFNPYPIPIKLPRFKYGVDIEGARFFNSESPSQLNLPASGVGTVSLPTRLLYTDLLGAYNNLTDRAEADYTLHANMILPILGQSLELPISHSGSFPILRPPTFSNINVDVSTVSLFKTVVNVDAAMKNPNAFALGIEDLGYILKLGGVELGSLTATTAGSLDAGQKGKLSLSGEISAASAIVKMIRGGNLGGANILPSGSIQTPYGPVKLQR